MKPAAMKRGSTVSARSPREWPGMGKSERAFSLIELMAATAILVIILGIIFSITQQISGAWKNSTAKIEAFQGSRAAYEAMTKQISMATLNTYYDYFDGTGKSRSQVLSANPAASFTPARYGRNSDLEFVSGKALVGTHLGATVKNQVGHSVFFQAPVGYTDKDAYADMDMLLNACGYYVVYDKDNSRPLFLDDSSIPNTPAVKHRFRLMQFLEPGQSLQVYNAAVSPKKEWFEKSLASTTSSPPVRILAENVVALILVPQLAKAEDGAGNALTPDFEYDSRPKTPQPVEGLTDYQLPPVMEVIMVAIDEPSAQRFCTTSTAPDFGIAGGLGTLFQQVSKLEDDLDALKEAFEAKHIVYRIFRSQVAVRGAKWS